MESFAVEGKVFEPWCVRPDERPVEPLFGHGGSMDKVASSLAHVPALQSFINNAKPEEGWYPLLIHALGTDEVWGPNRKADSFLLEDLVPMDKSAAWGFKSFEKKAQGYVHHRNSPDRWTGRVLLSAYSTPMGRVELIAKFNLQRLRDEGAPYFADALEQGELPAVSMGTRVPHDSCSICGNKATNVLQYCDHLKNHRLEILPDGRRVRMFNKYPVFHDISLVSSPADRAARVLMKVAEELPELKVADIMKQIPMTPMGGLRVLRKGEYAATLRTDQDPDLSLRKLMKAASNPLVNVFSALTGLGILLRPHEFAALQFAREGKAAAASIAMESRSTFPIYDVVAEMPWPFVPLGPGDWLDDVGGRSIYIPAFSNRLDRPGGMVKRASGGSQGIPESIHYGYGAYRNTAEQYLLDGTAARWVHRDAGTLTRVLGRDIPLVTKAAQVDQPRDVFEALVRGGYLPTLTVLQ